MTRYLIVFFLLAASLIFIGMPAQAAENRYVILVVAPENFRDEEYFTTKKIIENAGFNVITVSTRKGTLNGVMGGKAESMMTLSQVKMKDYGSVVFIGGPGAQALWDNKQAWRIGTEAKQENKIVGAICVAPVILANAGLLKGVKATCFPGSSLGLKKNGADYVAISCIRDGNIITANGPEAAEEFGKTLAGALKGK